MRFSGLKGSNELNIDRKNGKSILGLILVGAQCTGYISGWNLSYLLSFGSWPTPSVCEWVSETLCRCLLLWAINQTSNDDLEARNVLEAKLAVALRAKPRSTKKNVNERDHCSGLDYRSTDPWKKWRKKYSSFFPMDSNLRRTFNEWKFCNLNRHFSVLVIQYFILWMVEVSEVNKQEEEYTFIVFTFRTIHWSVFQH